MVMVNAPIYKCVSSLEPPAVEIIASLQNVVSRSTHKLRSREGREIYFYSNGKYEGFYDDRLEFSTMFRILDDELRRVI